MRTKLLLIICILNTLGVLSQTPVNGDYRSKSPGPLVWNNATSWEIYNGTYWVNATSYPGLTNGTYNVQIRSGHIITMPSNVNNSPNKFGTLTINGQLEIINNQNAFLNATAIVVTKDVGSIYFSGQANLYLPENTSLTVFPANNSIIPTYPGGLITNGACSNSQRIYIGSIYLASCQGAGNGPMLSFSELQNTNGSLTGVLDVVYECDKATITPRHIGLIIGSNREYQMIVRNPAPANDIILNTGLISYNPSNVTSYTIDIPQYSIYTIELIFKIDYSGGPYSNTRFIDLYSYIRWDGTSTSWIPSYLTPDISIRATIDGNYNTGTHGDFSACSLIINSGATLNIAPETYIETENHVTNNGTINILNSGNLVQKDNAATFIGTNNTVTRISRPMKKLDYVYWGSPVETPTTLTAAPISTYFDLFFRWNLSGTATGSWAGLTQTPAIGNGFIARVRPSLFPEGSPATATTTTQFVFNGKLNSGLVSINANVFPEGDVNVNDGNSVLLANPYPSAINALTLLNSNPQIVKLLFWTSYTVYTGSGQYQVSDYATFNLTGGIGLGESPGSTGGSTDLTPQGYIASGQGFFAHVTTPGTIEFNNFMRVRGSNSQFFRSSAPETLNEVTTGFERHRLWINFSNNTNAHRQLLLGYLEGATNEYDNRYDAISSTTNQIDIYTILEDTKQLAIQGRALPFNNTDIIPLGYRVTNAGNYTITLSDMDGLFTDYDDIYLKNNITNTYHNLKNGSFTFNAQAGTFNDHFEIHFVEQTLGINPVGSANNLIIYGANGVLNVKGFETNIQSIEVFDLVGKLLFVVNDVNTLDYISPSINTTSPILIARVTDQNNHVTTKKVILK